MWRRRCRRSQGQENCGAYLKVKLNGIQTPGPPGIFMTAGFCGSANGQTAQTKVRVAKYSPHGFKFFDSRYLFLTNYKILSNMDSG